MVRAICSGNEYYEYKITESHNIEDKVIGCKREQRLELISSFRGSETLAK